jgi:hypothetical protein
MENRKRALDVRKIRSEEEHRVNPVTTTNHHTSYSREHFRRVLSGCDAPWAFGIAQTSTVGKGRNGSMLTCLCHTQPTQRTNSSTGVILALNFLGWCDSRRWEELPLTVLARPRGASEEAKEEATFWSGSHCLAPAGLSIGAGRACNSCAIQMAGKVGKNCH